MFLSGVPVLDEEANDCARRFISLVDELYDRRVQLIMAAEVEVHQLYAVRVWLSNLSGPNPGSWKCDLASISGGSTSSRGK